MLVTPPDQPICLDEAWVVLPYAGEINEEVHDALEAATDGFKLRIVDVGHSDTAYYELIRNLWEAGECFCLVEHDIVVNDGVIESFDNCGYEWCVAQYRYFGALRWGLGCTRFRRPLLRRFPDLMADVGRREMRGHPPGHWCTLDNGIGDALLIDRSVALPHLHGEVRHLHDRPTHGCVL